MRPPLFADAAPPPVPPAGPQPADDGDPMNIVIVVGGLFVFAVLWWLYAIGFYGKAFRALCKTAVVVGVGTAGLFAIAAMADQAAALSGAIAQNAEATGITLAVFALAGLVYFYDSKAGAPASAAATGSSTERVPVPAGLPGSVCPACRGAGTGERECGDCNGMGERTCSYVERGKHWWGEEYDKRWCKGGVIYSSGNTAEDRCGHCNGRGFYKCYTCRGRGTVKGTCEKCQG